MHRGRRLLSRQRSRAEVRSDFSALVFLRAFAREDLDVHDDAFDARRTNQGCIADVACFLAKDRAQKSDRTLARSSFSAPLREKILTSTTMPSMPGGQIKDASRTSPAFSPKIARRSPIGL